MCCSLCKATVLLLLMYLDSMMVDLVGMFYNYKAWSPNNASDFLRLCKQKLVYSDHFFCFEFSGIYHYCIHGWCFPAVLWVGVEWPISVMLCSNNNTVVSDQLNWTTNMEEHIHIVLRASCVFFHQLQEMLYNGCCKFCLGLGDIRTCCFMHCCMPGWVVSQTD